MSTRVSRKKIIDFSVSTGNYVSIVDEIMDMAKTNVSASVYFANVHMYIEAYKNETFRSQVNSADIVTADGQPIAWILDLIYGIKQDRVAGMDVLPDLLMRMSEERLPVYFYGGTQEMLDRTKDYLSVIYPDLLVAGLFSPPFRPLTHEEEDEIVDRINTAAPSIVFIVLGCPQQEKWVAGMKGRINAVMAAIGGALPVMIGMQNRAPMWMRRNGLEWLYRLYKEPARLYKRYVTTNSLFIWIMIREFFKVRFRKVYKD